MVISATSARGRSEPAISRLPPEIRVVLQWQLQHERRALARRRPELYVSAQQARELAREREVAELVAQALSNKEVASKLVLSERTVESHVRNILTKTGLRSRTELTRWILQSHTR